MPKIQPIMTMYTRLLYLYGKARVTYEDFELDADYIRVDEKNNCYLQEAASIR